jgi:hypothetical protein
MKTNSLILAIALSASTYSINSQAAYVWAWGDNSLGQTNVPAGLTNAIAISAGWHFNLVLRADGTVVTWGNNNAGSTNVPSGLSNVVAIAAGGPALALKSDGTVVVWGTNHFNPPLDVPTNLASVVAVAAGIAHCLALKANGTVVCWGDNGLGQCIAPSDLTNAVAVAGGADHSLALRANGTVSAWGDNLYGECNVPPDLTNAIAISAGQDYSLAVHADGSVTAWGWNFFGQCNVPANLSNAIAVAAGFDSSLALRADGTIVGWGNAGPIPSGLANATAIGVEVTGPSFLALANSPQPSVTISSIGPPSQTVEAGSQAFFSVGASGMPPLSYQWYFGSNSIAGETNRWLVLNNVQTSQSGMYSVVVSNPEGSATSRSVSLSVIPAIDINLVPAITLKGSVGWTYRIEYLNAVGPTNAWATLATVTLTNSPEFYFDASAIGQPARVYRLVQLP